MDDKALHTSKELVSKIINIQDKNKFDCLMQEFENYIEGAVAHNMSDLKEKQIIKKERRFI